MRNVSPWVFLMTTALVSAGTALADNAKPDAGSSSADLCPMNEAQKVRSALIAIHNANRDEIALGKLAQDRAQSPDVKQYATMMVQDHTAGDKKLVELAKKEKIDLTLSPGDPVRAALGDASRSLENSISNLHGPAFDAGYVAPQVLMHEFVLGVVDEAEKVATQPDIKSFLAGAQKVVTEHRDHWLTLQNRLSLGETPVGGGPGETPQPSHSGAAPAPSASGEHMKPQEKKPENPEAPAAP
jgi:putative membrane protein